jgi:hypothetical protein
MQLNGLKPTEIHLRCVGLPKVPALNQPLDADDDCPVSIPALPDDDKCNDDVRVPGWEVFWTDDLLHNQQLNPGRVEIQSVESNTPNAPVPPAYDGTLQKAELDSHHRVDEDGNPLHNN